MSSPQAVLFDAPGPKARVRHNVLTVVGVLLALGILYLVWQKMSDADQLEPDKWTPFFTGEAWREYLLRGLWGTLRAAAVAVVLAVAFGIALGMGRLAESAPIRWVCGAVVEFFRAVPVLLMMIFLSLYFAQKDILTSDTRAFAAVVIALTLYNGSVVAELVRSGVHSLPRGQSEAGLSIGLTPFQALRLIELPQAITAMLPALIGQLVVALKDTALGYVIIYGELLTWSKTLGSAYANIVPAYLFAALLFIVINYLLTRLAAGVEQRLKRRGTTVIPVAGPVQPQIGATL
jgi:glutamate transport system permease protein